MSYALTVKFAPCFTFDRFNDPQWTKPGRTMYSKLEFPPGSTSVPLLVDHKREREIGTVTGLHRWDWLDGDWYFATATLPNEPPSWLTRHCPASFGFAPLHHNQDFTVGNVTADVLYHGFVKEVSVLVGKRRAEPLAEVVLLERAAVSPAAVGLPPTGVAGEIILGDGRPIRRYFPTAITVR